MMKNVQILIMASLFGSISVAYGNIPAPGREKTGTKDKVPGIVLGDFAERASTEKEKIGISVSIL